MDWKLESLDRTESNEIEEKVFSVYCDTPETQSTTVSAIFTIHRQHINDTSIQVITPPITHPYAMYTLMFQVA